MLRQRVNIWKQWMARLTALLIVSVYLFFSIGILKATHFCMGREASVSWFTTEAEKCPCSLYGGEKGSCCDDEHELLRIDNEQKIITAFAAPAPEWIALREVTIEVDASHVIIAGQAAKAYNDAPPPKVPRWKRLCTLVFYDDHLVG